MVQQIGAVFFASSHQMPMVGSLQTASGTFVRAKIYRLLRTPFTDCVFTESTLNCYGTKRRMLSKRIQPNRSSTCIYWMHSYESRRDLILWMLVRNTLISSRLVLTSLAVSIQRKVLLPFQLPSGGIIPAGNLIAVPQQAVLMNENFYPTPDHFDPYRYSPNKNRKEYQGFTTRFTDVSLAYPFWGSPRKPCPGRWYVADTLKLALIHLINNYEFKLEKEDAPCSFFWTTAIVPRRDTMILMKPRTKSPLKV